MEDFCSVCGLVGHLTELCPLLHSGTRVLDAPLPSKAILTLPENIEAKIMVPGKFDIKAKRTIPKGVQFGPLDSPQSSEYNPKCSYMLKLFRGKNDFYYLDTSDENKCNWMTLVPFTEDSEAKNCIAYQLCDDIFFTVIADVEPGHSLLVGYAAGYLRQLRIHEETLSKQCSIRESSSVGDYGSNQQVNTSPTTRRSGRRKKAVNYVLNLVDSSSHNNNSTSNNEASTGFTEVVNSGSNFTVINSSILEDEEADPVAVKFEEASVLDDRGSSSSDDSQSDFDPEDGNIEADNRGSSSGNDNKNKPSRAHYPKKKSTRRGAVLAVDEWKCKFCHKIETTITEFASHLIEHYKTVGAARTEKSRLSKRSDPTSSEDTCQSSEENSIKEEPTERNSISKPTEPRFPYTCDICLVKKIFNRGEYIIRHLRNHTGDLTCSICNQVFTKEQYSTHECSEQDEDSGGSIHKCPICHKLYRSEKRLQIHLETVHSKGSSIQCSKCQKSFIKFELYEAHKCEKRRTKQRSVKPSVKRKKVEDDVLVLHKCEVCEFTFSKTRDLEKHLKSHGDCFTCSTCGKLLTNRTFKIHNSICKIVSTFLSKKEGALNCPKCIQTFDDLESFRGHLATHTHPAMCPECNLRLPSTMDIKSHSCVRFKCDGCREEFETLINLKKHIAGIHGGAQYYCYECAIPFVTQDDFKLHRGCGSPEDVAPKQKQSQDDGMYVCEVCGTTYTKWSSLKTHRYTHGPKRFSCDTCGKSFHRREMLTDHEFVHQEAQFQCSECEKRLKSKKSLEVHMQIHRGNKRFQCEKCAKAFCQKINLQTHMLVHLTAEEKGFECSYCHKKFASKEYLGFHIEAHTKGKNEVCDICGKSFVKVHMLNQHRKTAHGNQKYLCEFCNLIVRQKQSLTRHLITQHEEFKQKWNSQGYVDSRYLHDDASRKSVPPRPKRKRMADGSRIYTVSDDDGKIANNVDLPKSVQLLSEVIDENCEVETEEITYTHDDMMMMPDNSNMMILQVEEGGEIVLTLTGPDSTLNGETVVERVIVEESLEQV